MYLRVFHCGVCALMCVCVHVRHWCGVHRFRCACVCVCMHASVTVVCAVCVRTCVSLWCVYACRCGVCMRVLQRYLLYM